MRFRQAVLVQIAFRRIHHVADLRRMALDSASAVVPEQGRRVNIVMFGQQRNDILPDAARTGHAME